MNLSDLWQFVRRVLEKQRFITIGVNFEETGYKKEKPPSMIITVYRTDKTNDGIFGHLEIDTDPFKCVTMEITDKAIQPGVYAVRWMWSEHFQQVMPYIVVAGREAIEFHWANRPTQLEGCIALGTSTELPIDTIWESKKAWVGFIKAVINEPNLTLKVIEDYGPVASA